jgi:predicted nucleotidyltransferase
MRARNRELLIQVLEDFFRRESDHCGIEMAFLYGSWSRGYPIEDSDVDLAVCFQQPRGEGEAFRAITNISVKLSRLLGVEVDVIVVYKDFRKPMLYYNAIVLGVPVYVREAESYIGLRNQAIAQMEDFGLFGLQWQKQTTQNNLEVLKDARISLR